MKKFIPALWVLAAALVAGADDKPKADKAPGDLKGTWEITAVQRSDKGVTGLDTKLVIGEKEMEWADKVPSVFDAKGKGAVTIDAKKSPPTIELKVGDAVYKGIWKITESPKGDKDTLRILLSDAGGDFPKDFPELLPASKQVLVWAQRPKK